jgi:hypothetical protein
MAVFLAFVHPPKVRIVVSPRNFTDPVLIALAAPQIAQRK